MLDETAQDASLDAEVVSMVRETAKRVTGGNCTFVDDDLNLLGLLATRAILAGLAEDANPRMLERMLKAVEPEREAHEAALGRPIPKPE